MSITDLNFLFRFLPVFLAVYYLTPARYRIFVLIPGSLLFYSFFDVRYAILLFALSVLNYYLAKAGTGGSRLPLCAAVVIDASVLVFCKVFAQFSESFMLPVGMSFYIFRMISFAVDCRRKVYVKEPSLSMAMAYFCLFPQLLSGPIMRYSEYEKISAFREPPAERTTKTALRNILMRIENGCTFFMLGFSLKILLADHLASMWSALYGIGYESLSTPLAWLGAYAYSLQLYYDFWGYSLMAAGVGIMIGLPMVENFLQPYASDSVSMFYRRWHATLGSFFRDYVYFPLGGSRKGTWITVRNLAIVWLLTGLWHGIGVGFLLWAGAILVMILIERALKDRVPVAYSVLGRIHVWVMIPLTWVCFAIREPERLGAYFLRLFPVAGTTGTVYAGDFVKYLTSYGVYLFFSLVFLIPAVYHGFVRHRRSVAVTILLAVLFVMSLVSASRAAANPFLYLQF